MLNCSVCVDSRLVTKGDIFVAIDCTSLASNVRDAINNGADIIFVDHKNRDIVGLLPDPAWMGSICYVDDIRYFASHIYRMFYRRQPGCSVAITGTNGKTSSVKFLEAIWKYCGYKSGSIGTIGISIDCNVVQYTKNTTPGPSVLYKMLDNMYERGVTNVAFEVSSHSVRQKRFSHVNIDLVAITNIAEDHIYYHKNLDDYRMSKLELLDFIGQDKYAVVSMDDERTMRDVIKRHSKVITFGICSDAYVRASNVSYDDSCVKFNLTIGDVSRYVEAPVVGEYQVKNILCACSCAIATGCKTNDVFDAIGSLPKVSGRAEFVTEHNGGKIFVDFAHNGDGLRNCLKFFRSICYGKLICVFGVSDKDYEIRCKQMADSVSEYCDYAIVTDDNIDNKTKRDIIADMICRELQSEKHTYCSDRFSAIQIGVSMIGCGDILVVAGRGPEPKQLVGGVEIDFRDRDKITEIVNKLSL